MTLTSPEKLQKWYATRCDGEWEHDRRIRISTLDNPGWSLEVNLAGTKLYSRPAFTKIDERSEKDWIHYSLEEGIFRAAGGAENLAEIVDFFLAWAEEEE